MFNNSQPIPSPNSVAIEGIGLILKALDLAVRKHRDQRRKDQAASSFAAH